MQRYTCILSKGSSQGWKEEACLSQGSGACLALESCKREALWRLPGTGWLGGLCSPSTKPKSFSVGADLYVAYLYTHVFILDNMHTRRITCNIHMYKSVSTSTHTHMYTYTYMYTYMFSYIHMYTYLSSGTSATARNVQHAWTLRPKPADRDKQKTLLAWIAPRMVGGIVSIPVVLVLEKLVIFTLLAVVQLCQMVLHIHFGNPWQQPQFHVKAGEVASPLTWPGLQHLRMLEASGCLALGPSSVPNLWNAGSCRTEHDGCQAVRLLPPKRPAS